MYEKRPNPFLLGGLQGLAIAFYAAIFMAFAYGIYQEVNGYPDAPAPKAPTYHCDGPGYPAPGTPEARACWIEESK